MPARKLFALSQVGNCKRKHSAQVISDEDDDETDDFTERRPSKNAKSTKIDDMKLGINKINDNLDYIFKLSKDMTLPPAVHTLITDTFECNICHSVPMSPPPIYGKCCKRLIGCQECVDKWYSTEEGISNACPICRGEKAFAESSQVRGMDEFLNGIKTVLNGTEN